LQTENSQVVTTLKCTDVQTVYLYFLINKLQFIRVAGLLDANGNRFCSNKLCCIQYNAMDSPVHVESYAE
jgi:hypothetical protein